MTIHGNLLNPDAIPAALHLGNCRPYIKNFLPHVILLIGFTSTSYLYTTDASAARQNRLTPAKIAKLKASNDSFRNCRSEALKDLRQGSSRRRFATALQGCKERFPGASLYTRCKKQALRKAKITGSSPNKNLRRCKRYLLAASFDPAETLPFFIKGNQVFFGGVGLNKSLPLSTLKPPNFSCDRLRAVMRDSKNAQHILFGNHPRTFGPLAKLSNANLKRALPLGQSQETGTHVEGFGKIFGNPENADAMTFFPAAPCDFEGRLGSTLAGLSAYYLLDSQASVVTPYFGIAYYQPNQKQINTETLVGNLKKELGSNYQAYRKDSRVTFITSTKIDEIDEEQDPKNLCRSPRKHNLVGIVHGRTAQPEQPEYAVVGHVANLCTYGDKLAKRLVR